MSCRNCKQPFTRANVFTVLGMKETAISGLCEICFDGIMADPEDDPELVDRYESYMKKIQDERTINSI